MAKLTTTFALAAVLVAAKAPAAIMYFDPDPDIVIATNYAGVSVNLETGAVSNDLNGVAGGDANFFFGGAELSNDADVNAVTPRWHPVRLGPGNTDVVANLSLDTPVDAGSTFGTGFGGSGNPNSHFPTFTAGTPGYLGFSLELDGGGTAYGWMEVTFESDGVTPGAIHRWAYESEAGTTILVGAIPEPGAGVLVLLGLAGFVLRRRRR